MQLCLAGLLWVVLSSLAVWIPAWWLWNTFISTKFGLPPLNLIESTGVLIYLWLATKGASKISVELKGRT